MTVFGFIRKSAYAVSTIETVDFILEKTGFSVASRKAITDFNANKFILYEFSPLGYAIYTEDDKRFIEGSYETFSPYHKFLEDKLYYLGPGNYFSETEYELKNITENRSVESEELRGEDFILGKSFDFRSSSSSQDPSKTHVDSSNFTVIDHDVYFRRLKQKPENTKGTCGLVAFCMIMAYWDTFGSPGFINNRNYTTEAEVPMNYDPGLETAIKQMQLSNFNEMPGASQSLHDSMFPNMYTIPFTGGANGYPMGATEMELQMNRFQGSYMGLEEKKNYKQTSGALFYTHAKPKELINRGIPCIIISTKFNYDTGGNKEPEKYHSMVAYGYKNDTFLVNMGWSYGNETIVSNATIHSYFTVEYTGEHRHNYVFKSNYYAACGCGDVLKRNRT